MIPVKWWWSSKRVDRWVQDNNPHDPESIEGLMWEARQHGHAADIFGQSAERFGIASIVFASIAVIATIVGFVAAVAS